jgi:hypothetical protein
VSEPNKDSRRLSGNEGRAFAKKNLVQVKVDSVNWKVLWQNPQTGEFWKEVVPHSEMDGGGPSEFLNITEEEAKSEFDL